MAKIAEVKAISKEDIARMYSTAKHKAQNRSRVTEQGSEYADFIKKVFEVTEADSELFLSVVYMAGNNLQDTEMTKLEQSMRAWIKTNGSGFTTFNASANDPTLPGKALWIKNPNK